MSALLPMRMVEKPWGRADLPPPFAAPPQTRIGEIWFEPPAGFAQLLIKHIFTAEALSVQVHPGGPAGKEECWLITAADPGAKLGLGFRRELSREEIRAAASDGTIGELLDWLPVAPGDFFYIPAGTVHAIGAGLALIEVQQNRDVTYRLYDYGRPRELHLDAGAAAASGGPYDRALHRKVPSRGSVTLVDGPHFRLDRLDGLPDPEFRGRCEGPLLIVPLDNPVQIDGETVSAGTCGLARSVADIAFDPTGRTLIAQPA